MKKYTRNFEGFEECWKQVIYKSPLDITQQLRSAVEGYYKLHSLNAMDFSPHHIAMENGTFELCQYIIRRTCNKNPANKYGFTPLHHAAGRGLLDVCQLIMENLKDKNPFNFTRCLI